MKISDRLPDDQKEQLNKLHTPKRKRNKQKLSINEIHDLMGIKRDIYERRGGVVRRKN